ncbi:hypothetical protein KAR91_85455 [Candidatus Pacearchaeota archaeon]|nr:hypothetical protein [Candidatus Pacearchaeota archaeon]
MKIGKRSYWRGHAIVFLKGQWLYDDTKEPTPGYGGKYRPCGACKKTFDGSYDGEADPCLGELPGVDNACCGHGIQAESYIRFTNGITIKNFDIEYPNQNKENQ